MLSRCIHVARTNEIRIPVINPIEKEIKELIGYYKFTTRRRVQTNNHLEALTIKDGSSYATKD